MKQLKNSIIKSGYGLFCAVFFMVFASVGFSELPQDSFRILSLHEKGLLTSAVFTYTSKILELNQDILNIRNDREWVKVKIQNIQDQNRTIPRELRQADTTLGRKVQLMDKEILRLYALSRQHLDALLLLDRQVKVKHQNETPSWWYLEKWLVELMYPDAIKKQHGETAAKVKNNIRQYKVASPPEHKAIIKALQEKIDAVGLENWVALMSNESPLRLEVQLPILFGSGKTDVAKDYKIFFRKLSWLLKPYLVKVEVAGYTDSNSVRGGKYSSNIELGASRAANVVRELIETGMKQSVFRIVSQGEISNEKIKENDKLSAAMKRRVEVNVFFENDGA